MLWKKALSPLCLFSHLSSMQFLIQTTEIACPTYSEYVCCHNLRHEQTTRPHKCLIGNLHASCIPLSKEGAVTVMQYTCSVHNCSLLFVCAQHTVMYMHIIQWLLHNLCHMWYYTLLSNVNVMSASQYTFHRKHKAQYIGAKHFGGGSR